MPKTDNSVWAYHRSMLKADGLVIAGAVSGIGIVTQVAVTLHEFSNPVGVAFKGCAAAAILLTAISVAGRELLRRKSLTTGRPLAARFPKSAYIATCLASLTLTVALTRTHLETGVAVYQGRQHLAVGDYQAAADCFSRVIELAPDRAKGYCLRGLAMYYSGQTDAAYDDLQLALELQPENRAAQTLFMATLERKSPTEALKTDTEAMN